MIDQLIEGELMERAFPNLDTNSFEKMVFKKKILLLSIIFMNLILNYYLGIL